MRNSCKAKIVVILAMLMFSVLNAAGGSISLTCNTSTPNAEPGSTVDYSLTISSTRSWGFIWDIGVLLPDGFTYVSGSASGDVYSEPTIYDQELVWDVVLYIGRNQSITFDFSATASASQGSFYIYAEASGYHINPVYVGPTAEVSVSGNTAPLLVLNKTVDKTTSLPGDQLTYTLSYLNSGDGAATDVTIYETIPATTNYIAGTASGTGMTITYSHDGGTSYNNEETSPITDLSFKLANSLAAGDGGSVSYKVEVK